MAEDPDDATQTTPAAPPAFSTAPPRKVVGRFEIVAALGAGGMADVYRAYDPALDRDVALKVLRTKGVLGDSQPTRRVLREARAAAALTHPNTVTIFDVGEADGEVWIAMELLEGQTLRATIERMETSLEQKLKWLLQAARALEAAHERGLVHRDVKPDNMFICTDGTLKLLDFGIAKREEDDSHDGGPTSLPPSSIRTAAGRRVGTPRYMAPEQHSGRATDARTDEYAWGLVAFELLTGGHAVAAAPTVTMEDTKALTDGVGQARLAELRAKVPALPEAVAGAVLRALEPEMDARFPSMAPVLEVLERDPAPDPPQPKPWWLAVSVGVLVALTIGAAALRRSLDNPAFVAPPRPSKACRAAPVRSAPLGREDRAAALPTGELVLLRDIRKGLSLTREAPAGPVPFATSPALAAVGNDYEDVSLRGMLVDGAPAAALFIDQGPIDGASILTLTDQGHVQQRVPPPIAGIVGVPFGKGIVLGVTTLPATNRFMNLPTGAEVYLPATRAPVSVERGSAGALGLATTDRLIALAYVFDVSDLRRDLHLAILDARGERLGDIVTLATDVPPSLVPAVAFAGDTVLVYWSDDRGAQTRLTMATFKPGDAAPAAPKVMLAEPITRGPPVAARLRSGRSLLGWVASVGATTVLRVSPIGAAGELTGATDVATVSSLQLLGATPGERSVFWHWVEMSTAKVADVSCE